MVSQVHLETEEALGKFHELFSRGLVGQCVGGVTHDINNYLGVVLAYVELIELENPLSKEAKRMVGEIVAGIRKSSELLSMLTEVARRRKSRKCRIEPAELVKRVIELRRYDLKIGQIRLETSFENGQAMIMGDRPRLEKVLLSLIENAIEAVNSDKDKRIAVRVRDGGEAVAIEVWNSGETVDEADRELIFEPFRTMKDGDGHLGLGLSAARETVQEHNGELFYDAARGFVMCLPKANGEASVFVGR